MLESMVPEKKRMVLPHAGGHRTLKTHWHETACGKGTSNRLRVFETGGDEIDVSKGEELLRC